jgi:type II secretion system protein N
VQKLGRFTLLSISGPLVLAVVVFLALNLYVQSLGTQGRIQQELRQRFGANLTIGRISVTPWSGLKLSDITMAQGANAAAANFLEARNFGLRIAFFSIFTRHLVIKELSLVGPKVVWPQNPDGKWRLPELRGSRAAKNTNVAEAENLPAAQTTLGATAPELAAPVTGWKAPAQPARRSDSEAGLIAEIHKVSLSDGSFRFLDRSSDLVANFDGVVFRAAISNGSALKGNAKVNTVSVRDRFFLQKLRSPLQYDANGLDLSHISAELGGGEVSGRFAMEPETEESPFRVEMKFRGIQADRVITEAGGPSGVLQGKLEGSLQIAGKTTDPEALSGNGEIFLKDGQLRQYDLLVTLGQLFQIEELTQLHLDQAQAKYHLSPGVVTIDELVLRSPNIHLSASGTVGFRGKLHLNSRLAINEKIREQLFKPVRANFQPTEEAGYSGVDFEVTGTLERPKTNLLEKVAGRDLKEWVNSLWGGGKSEKQKKKKGQAIPDESAAPANPETNAAPPAPSPSGSP